MRRTNRILCVWVAALNLSPLLADPARDLRVRADLDFLVSSIRSRHPNPYTKISRGEFERRVQDLSDAIPALSDAQAYVRIKGIAASIGDAHTALSLTAALSAIGAQLFPIRFTLFDDGLFVSSAAVSHRSYLGRRVISINGRTWEQLLDAIRPFVSFENEQWLKMRLADLVFSPQLLHAAGIGGQSDVAEIVLEDPLGRRETLQLPGDNAPLTENINAADIGYLSPTYLDLQFAYWYRYYPEQNLLFFKYNSCQEMPGFPFSAFSADLFRTLDSHDVDHLVVDLRDNAGGNSEVWRPFLNGLNQRYASLRARNSSFRFYGLISRLTFSSGMLAAEEIKRFAGALLVGEATGGNPESFGDTASFNLPNLKAATLSVSTRSFLPFVPGIRPPAIEPDIRAYRDSSDVFARFDPVLFTVFALSERSNANAGPSRTGAVVSAASFRPGSVQSPGALSSAFGDFGVPALSASTLPLPMQLGGIELSVGGRPAPLLLVSPGQINFQQPAGPFSEREEVTIRSNGSVIWTGTQETASEAPALFVTNAANFRQPGAVLNQDGSLNALERPAHRGERIQLFATGYPELKVPVTPGDAPGATLAPTRVTPRVLIGQWDMPVEFSGASPQFPGLWQINAVIPLTEGIARLMPVAVLVNGRWSNAVSIWVE